MSDPTHRMKIGGKWVDVPDWAKWVVQERCGSWFFFQYKPSPSYGYWWIKATLHLTGSMGFAETITAKPKDYREELYRIEREK